MDPTTIAQLATDAQAALTRLTAALVDSTPVLRAGGNLQAALDAGDVTLEAGATWEGTYTLRSGHTMTGRAGSAIHGTSGPALIVKPVMTGRIAVSDLRCTSDSTEGVIEVGENSTRQTTIADAPTDVMFSRVVIPSHRGKRGFAIHGFGVRLLECEVLDTWSAAIDDSQAVYLGNAPGLVYIRGGRYSAGSEVILSGGDSYKIPGNIPDGILLDGVEIFRPLSWKDDGVNRKIKTLFENKNGRKVVLRGCTLHGCWKASQDGTAILLTPANDGSVVATPKPSGDVQDVTIDNCEIFDVGSGMNIVGRGSTSVTRNAQSGLLVRNSRFTVTTALGGRGILALMQGEAGAVAFDGVTFRGDGNSCLYYAAGSVLDPVTGLKRKAGKLGSLTVARSMLDARPSGILTDSGPNAANWQNSIAALSVTGNTFVAAAPALKTALPSNTFVEVWP